jgi:hypothetical protein
MWAVQSQAALDVAAHGPGSYMAAVVQTYNKVFQGLLSERGGDRVHLAVVVVRSQVGLLQ